MSPIAHVQQATIRTPAVRSSRALLQYFCDFCHFCHFCDVCDFCDFCCDFRAGFEVCRVFEVVFEVLYHTTIGLVIESQGVRGGGVTLRISLGCFSLRNFCDFCDVCDVCDFCDFFCGVFEVVFEVLCHTTIGLVIESQGVRGGGVTLRISLGCFSLRNTCIALVQRKSKESIK